MMRKLLPYKYILLAAFALTLVLGVGFVGNSSQVKQEAQAATVTGYVAYTEANGCVDQSGSVTISDADMEKFDGGVGLTQGNQVVYKRSGSSPLYMCCVEQIGLTGSDVQGCSGVTPPGPNAGSENPWLATSQSNFYLKYGTVLAGAPTSGYFSTNKNQSKISEFTYATEMPSSTIPAGDLSHNQYTLFDFTSSGIRPPALSNFDDWYDYMKRLAEVNVITDEVTSFSSPATGTGTISGNLSTYFPTSSNPAVYETSGNVTIQSGAVCNTKALVFVNGNLTINPGVTIANKAVTLNGSDATGQACLFIVKGNTIIEAGGAAASTTGGNFDLLEIAVITGGKTEIKNDGTESLKVNGFLAGRYGDFQRDGGLQAPSVWIDYDGRYMQIFKQELKVNRFSTKEKGFVAGNF